MNVSEAKSQFADFYALNLERLGKAREIFRQLISNILDKEGHYEIDVTARVKDIKSCIEKIDRKYRSAIEGGAVIERIITDLIGVRVVCLYSSDVASIIKSISNEFDIIDETDKIAKLDDEEALFGYRAHHVTIALSERRFQLPEYEICRGLVAEVQVRTIVQDAWSSIDHKIRYKKEVPVSLKRRIMRLAALFELADQEFLSVRDMSNALEHSLSEIFSPDIQSVSSISSHPSNVDMEAVNEPATVFELLAIVRRELPNIEIPGYRLDEVMGSIRRSGGDISKRDMLSVSLKLKEAHEIYQKLIQNGFNVGDERLIIRIAFWLYDKFRFSKVIYDDFKKKIENMLT